MNSIVKTDKKQKLVAAIMGIAGLMIILIGTHSFGPGISHDSAAYIYASKSLLAGRGYEYFGYISPFIQWPPLFPTLLAVSGFFGIDPVMASRFINAVVFGLIVFLSGIWLGRHLKSKWIAGLGTVVVLLGAPLIYASSYVWTEPLFVLLFLLFLFELEKYIKQQNRPSLVKAAVAVAFACLDRYMGITMIFTACLILLFIRKKLIERFADAFVFGFISSLPTALWIVRNYIVSSTFVGLRTPASVTLYENIKRSVKTVISWLLPYTSLNALPAWLQAVALALMLLTIAVVAVMAYRERGNKEKTGAGRWLETNGLPAVILLVFIVIYTAWMIASATSVAFDAIGDRYMLPVYVPVFFVGLLLIDGAAFLAPRNIYGKVSEYILLASIALWLVHPAVGAVNALESRIEKGMPFSYNAAGWKSSPMVSLLKERKPEYTVYSNYPDAIYVLTGIEAKYTPKKAGLPEFYGFEKFEQRVKEDGGAYLAWFGKGTSATTYNPEELKEYFDVELLDKPEDGALYFIKPRS